MHMNHKLGLMAALVSGLSVGFGQTQSWPAVRRAPKRYPRMVTASDEEIAAHNECVMNRQVRRHFRRVEIKQSSVIVKAADRRTRT